MKRRFLLKILTVIAVSPLIGACSRGQAIAGSPGPITVTPLNKRHSTWRKFLSTILPHVRLHCRVLLHSKQLYFILNLK